VQTVELKLIFLKKIIYHRYDIFCIFSQPYFFKCMYVKRDANSFSRPPGLTNRTALIALLSIGRLSKL